MKNNKTMTTRVMFSTLFDRNIIFLMWFRLGYTLGLLRRIRPILFFLLCMASWRRLVVRASDLQSSPERLQVRVPAAPLHVTTLGKLFTHNVPILTNQYKLVPAIGWEGNRRSGVALRHWPCVTDSVVYPPYGLNGLGKGDEMPKLHSEHYGIFTFT